MSIFTSDDPAQQLDWLIQSGLIRLEITNGIPTWEMSPAATHQKRLREIARSLTPHDASMCACYDLQDTYIRFRDGSIKRPDLSIFCEEPPDTTASLNIVPDAVIEIVSEGSEYKDLQLNPPFYLAQGVSDVVVLEPEQGKVTHFRIAFRQVYQSPVTLDLLCGCHVTV